MSQKWYQLKCIDLSQTQNTPPLKSKKGLTLFICALFSVGALHVSLNTPVYAHPKKASHKAKSHHPSKGLPKLLEEVEAKYTQSTTLSADFTQLNEDALLSQKKTSSGKIYVKRPSKFRWETLKPEASLLVSDGSRFWYYTPPFDEGERGQLVEKTSSQVQSRLANALLSGSFSLAKDMTIKQKSQSTFIMIPKAGTAGTVTQATVEVDPSQKLIKKVILDHKGGNRSEISLSNIQLGEKLSDDLFIFRAPPNTDTINEKS